MIRRRLPSDVPGEGADPGNALYVNVAKKVAQLSDDSPFWSVTSDRRLKERIQQLTGALETVEQLNPVRYHYTAEHLGRMSEARDIEHYGVIAQEFQHLFPEFVATGPDGYLSVKSDPIVYVATAAIKELNAKHEAAMKQKDGELARLADENAAIKRQLAAQAAKHDARLARLEQAAPAASDQAREARLTRIEAALDNHPERAVNASLDLK